MFEYLTVDDVLAIRDRIAAKNVNSCAIRALGSLIAAVNAPQLAAFGEEAHHTLSEKAGALLYALIEFHPFWDGNKRIASEALVLFLQRNKMAFNVGDQELHAFTKAIALGTVRDDAITAWLDQHIERSA